MTAKLVDQINHICCIGMGADMFDHIHYLFSMAVVTDKMTLFAYGVGWELIATENTVFLSLFFQIDQWLAAQHAVLLKFCIRFQRSRLAQGRGVLAHRGGRQFAAAGVHGVDIGYTAHVIQLKNRRILPGIRGPSGLRRLPA